MRLFVFGRPVDQADAAQALRSISRATRLPMQLVRQDQVLSLPPNAFVVAGADLVGGFRGPLLPMLGNAMNGNSAAMEDFIAGVISIQPCWVLPVWTDAGQTALKAAIIGIDIRQKRPSIQHCMLRELAASVGLMGDGGTLPRSLFNPKLEVGWLSQEDAAMLRVLYGSALHPGMTRQEVVAAAVAALRVKLKPPPAPPLHRSSSSVIPAFAHRPAA